MGTREVGNMEGRATYPYTFMPSDQLPDVLSYHTILQLSFQHYDLGAPTHDKVNDRQF